MVVKRKSANTRIIFNAFYNEIREARKKLFELLEKHAHSIVLLTSSSIRNNKMWNRKNRELKHTYNTLYKYKYNITTLLWPFQCIVLYECECGLKVPYLLIKINTLMSYIQLLYAVQEFCCFLGFICSLAGWLRACVSVERFLPNLVHAIYESSDDLIAKNNNIICQVCDCWHSTNNFSHVPECRITLLCWLHHILSAWAVQKPNPTDMMGR